MVDQRILDWINEQKNKGYAPRQLRDSLIQQGYPPEDVNQAINISFGEANPNNNSTLTQKKNKKYWIIIMVIVLVLIVGGYFFLHSQGYFNSVKGNVKVENDKGSTKVTFSTGGDIPSSECTLSQDCSGGLECIQDKCTTVEDFYKDHVACCEEGMFVEGVSECILAKKNTDNLVYSCEQFECKNCEKGFQSCVISQTNGFFSYCAECLNSFSCKEGFNCEFGKCVSK